MTVKELQEVLTHVSPDFEVFMSMNDDEYDPAAVRSWHTVKTTDGQDRLVLVDC